MFVKIKKYGYLKKISRILCYLNLDKLAKKYEDRFNKNRAKVKFDYYDTWSLDETLALIIYPALLELKSKKAGIPFVDVEDVPEHLRPKDIEEYNRQLEYDGTTDDLFETRWEWVLDEMIYAFRSFTFDWEDEIYDKHEKYNNGYSTAFQEIDEEWRRIQNGLSLFAKYYTALWT